MRISKKLVIIVLLVSVLALGLVYRERQSNLADQAAALAALQADAARKSAKRKSEAIKPVPLPAVFSKTRFSVDDPNSIWVVVNKLRPLNPRDYVPKDLVAPAVPLRSDGSGQEMKLRQAAAQALEAMVAAAKADSANLMIASAYRSFNTQTAVYNREVAQFGQATADTQSARPGHSEHQTGLAVDLEPTSRQCEIEDCFAETIEGKWLAANSYKHGFLLRYTVDKVAVTGYRAESWHFRYVGLELAAEMNRQGITTLEEFFGLPAAPGY